MIPSRGKKTHNRWRIYHRQCRCCISGRKYQAKKRTGTNEQRVSKIRGRRLVIHQWKIRPSCHRAAGINKLRKSGEELEELELDLDPIAKTAKHPSSSPIRLVFASHHSYTYYSKKKSPSFVFRLRRKESEIRREILLKSSTNLEEFRSKRYYHRSSPITCQYYETIFNAMWNFLRIVNLLHRIIISDRCSVSKIYQNFGRNVPAD